MTAVGVLSLAVSVLALLLAALSHSLHMAKLRLAEQERQMSVTIGNIKVLADQNVNICNHVKMIGDKHNEVAAQLDIVSGRFWSSQDIQ